MTRTNWKFAGTALATLAFVGAPLAFGQAYDTETKQDKERTTRVKDQRTEHFYCSRCDQVIGATVKNREGKDLGEINDIVIDAKSGKIAYAVLSFGGFMGFGDKLFAIPFTSLDTLANGTMILDVDKYKLEESQGFDQDKWPNFADQRWATDTHKRFNQRPYWDNDRDGNNTYPDKPQRGISGSVVRVSQLIGTEVMGPGNKEVGTVKELILDCNEAQVALASVAFGGFAGFGDTQYAVPFAKLNVTPTTDDVKVNTTITQEQLKTAPKLNDDGSWERDQNRTYFVKVYEFYTVPPYWTTTHDYDSDPSMKNRPKKDRQ